MYHDVADDGDGRISCSEFHVYVFGDTTALLSHSLSGSDSEGTNGATKRSASHSGQIQQPELSPGPYSGPDMEPRQQPLSRAAQRYVHSLWRSLDRLQDPPAAVEIATGQAPKCTKALEGSDGTPINAADSQRKKRAAATVQREQQAKLFQRTPAEERYGRGENTPVDEKGQTRAKAVHRVMQLQQVAGQLLAAEAAASKTEAAMREIQSVSNHHEEQQLLGAGKSRQQDATDHAASLGADCDKDRSEEDSQRSQSWESPMKTALESEGAATSEEAKASDTEEEDDWSPQCASTRVASAASAAVAAAAVEEVARLRAQLADRDRQIAAFVRSKESIK